MADSNCTGKSRPVKIPTEKWFTIGKFYYYYTPTKDAPPNTPNRPVTVPWMQLKGRWLEKMGFTIGARVRVQVKPGRLVLTVEKE